jgi:hypothetical protein
VPQSLHLCFWRPCSHCASVVHVHVGLFSQPPCTYYCKTPSSSWCLLHCRVRQVFSRVSAQLREPHGETTASFPADYSSAAPRRISIWGEGNKKELLCAWRYIGLISQGELLCASEELYRSDTEPGRLVWLTCIIVTLVQWNAVFEGAARYRLCSMPSLN